MNQYKIRSLAKKCWTLFWLVVTDKEWSISVYWSNKLYVLTYTFKKKEVDMNVVRSYSNEGKTLQELMEILLPIYLQEKTCNKDEEELEFKTQNPK